MIEITGSVQMKFHCGLPEIPANGRVDLSSGSRGERAAYGCAAGYRIEGDSQRTCEGRHWQGPAPVCAVLTDTTFVLPSFPFFFLCHQIQIMVGNDPNEECVVTARFFFVKRELTARRVSIEFLILLASSVRLYDTLQFYLKK